jgi:nitronate monooxygenase
MNSSTAALTDLLKGSPLVQAPMAGVQGSQLAIAVSRAGGLGSLPCAMLSPAQIQEELFVIRAALGVAGRFNVNFFCHDESAFDAKRESAWQAALTPYYREFEIDPPSISPIAGRSPFGDALADLIEPFYPPVVSFHFGLPKAHLVERAKAWGACVLSSATTVEEAKWLEAHGVDAIIAQGLEAGGHRGMFLSTSLTTQVGLHSLVPQIAAAVSVPVIAAGGIASAEGVRASRALGAAGVQVGTAFLLCDEATTSTVHRAALESAQGAHTALTNCFTGRPARGIVNRLMRELGPMSPVAPAFPFAGAALSPLRAKAESVGSGDFSPLWSGQNVSGCKPVPAAQVVESMLEGL